MGINRDQPMKITTWNVNSVRARLERLLAWLQKAQPDILCLQWSERMIGSRQFDARDFFKPGIATERARHIPVRRD